MSQLATRLDYFNEYVIREMTHVSDAHGAITPAHGYPYFEPPPELLDAAERDETLVEVGERLLHLKDI